MVEPPPGVARGLASARMMDFNAIFEAIPQPLFILAPTLIIVAATDEFLRTTKTTRGSVIGRHVFDVFPESPAEGATNVSNTRASYDLVLATGRPHTMDVQRYDIQRPVAAGGGFEERHWQPVNTPVLGPDGRVQYIIAFADDVTERVFLCQDLAKVRIELAAALHRHE